VEKLDRHLQDLEAGHDALPVPDETDETVKKLVDTLRERGKEAAAS
jgi:hypothetical protein